MQESDDHQDELALATTPSVSNMASGDDLNVERIPTPVPVKQAVVNEHEERLLLPEWGTEEPWQRPYVTVFLHWLASKWPTFRLHLELHRHLLQRLSICLVGIVAASTIGSVTLLPQPIRFSFASTQNCTLSPMILPGLFHPQSSSVFELDHKSALSLFRIPLLSLQVCVTPTRPLQPSTAYSIPAAKFGFPFARSLSIMTEAFPKVALAYFNAQQLPLSQPIKFRLTSGDAVFGYELSANEHQAPCTEQAGLFQCNLALLKLNYGSTYSVSLLRTFRKQSVGVVFAQTVRTLTATSITQSSIPDGGTVYDNPTEISLTTSKPLLSLGSVSLTATLNGAVTQLSFDAYFKGSTITVHLHQAVPRRAAISLHISQVTAGDHSQFENPYDLHFTTSGGPKVTGVNIPTSGVNLSPVIVISFDQELLASASATSLVSFAVNGTSQPVTVSISGSQLIMRPINGLPRCARINIQTTSGLTSNYGFSGDSAWQYTSRTECYVTFSIGTSVEGRPITAYQFNSGHSIVLYVASMHGNESNTASLLQDWIAELDANPSSIPAGRTVVVIPEVNPDGVAAYTRQNAHNIDLNRNFPANSWQTQVTEPDGNGVITNDGGPYPLSEPESQALAAYVQSQRPRLVLTYHSSAGIVEANDAGDSDSLGSMYASKTDYRAIPTYLIGSTFDYSTTGAFEDWMHDKLGLPALVVELWTHSSPEFYDNLPAMWAMAQLP